MCLNMERDVSSKIKKPFVVSILYRPPDKIVFANCIDQIFSLLNKLKTQERFLLGDFNIKLSFKVEEIFSNKIALNDL